MWGSLFTLAVGLFSLFSTGGDSIFGWVLTVWGGLALLGSLGEDDPLENVDPEHLPQIRACADVFETEDPDADNLQMIGVDFKGMLPLSRPTNVSFVTTAMDVTDPDEPKPILSYLEALQEANTITFQQSIELGHQDPGDCAMDWIRAGIVLQDLVTPPSSGRRNLCINLFLIDADNPPPFNLGFPDLEHDGLLWADSTEYAHYFDGKGYLESIEDTKQGRVLAVKIAMAVVMADGALDTSEGEVLKAWVTRIITDFEGEKDEALKAALNEAMQASYQQALSGDLILSDLCRELNDLDLEPQKYETLQLCYDVMAADGVADQEELRVIKQIAESLEIDPDEEAKIRDGVLGKITTQSFEDGTDAILGIDPSWSTKEKKKHLRKEFAKWNARTSLPSPESDEAHRMLELIAAARQKYNA